MNKLSERMALLREERNIGQKELAAFLCCSTGTISNYENGVHEPCLDNAVKIAQFYQVSLDYLLGNTELRTMRDSSCPEISKGYSFSRFLNLLDDLLPEERRRLADYLLTLELAHKALKQ